jgi:hypothetical protein
LRRFISNLAGRIELFLPLVQLKHEEEFTWAAEQDEKLEQIRKYLTSCSVLRALKTGEAFTLHLAVLERVIGTALTQEENGVEFIVAYIC